MAKRLFSALLCAVLVLSLSATAFAGHHFGRRAVSYGGGCIGGGNLMWSSDGSFLDKDAFEERLDNAIDDGFISADDRDFYVERYDYCSSYGGAAIGVRGGCGGFRVFR